MCNNISIIIIVVVVVVIVVCVCVVVGIIFLRDVAICLVYPSVFLENHNNNLVSCRNSCRFFL